MKPQFNVGTHQLHDEPNMNFQLNRMYSAMNGDLTEIREAARKIKTLEDWKRVFLKLADTAETEGRLTHAAAYLRGAHFYMSPDDPDKMPCYDRFLALIRQIHHDDFESGLIKEFKVPYGNASLPVWRIDPADPLAPKKTVVMVLGFDALKEELIPTLRLFHKASLGLYLFEGPGQGETLIKQKIPMTHEYEKPVKAVLDHFELDDVTLIGLSLGGYLAPRASIFEPRVKRVVCWGVMYDFFDVVLSRRGRTLEVLLKTLLRAKASRAVNAIAERKMNQDTFAKWGIEHGMYALGAKSPYEYFSKLRLYSMKKISHRVTQDVLLLTGTDDHFVPLSYYFKQSEMLTNARSVTGRIFTKLEGAENHCQFGNIPLAIRTIIDWIKLQSS